MKNEKVRTVLIASGGGTDANAIMVAYRAGFIPNIDLVGLISTKAGEKCLEKADANNVPRALYASKDFETIVAYNKALSGYLKELKVKLIFLVGCIVKVYPIDGVDIYNIHPASLCRFGGKTMYGLKVHERVLENVMDLIIRGRRKITEKFFTYPTVHKADLDYDSGETLLVRRVKIPQSIINGLMSGVPQFKSLDLLQNHVLQYAELLQKHVLPYEWKMLPVAVKKAAQKILDERNSETK